MAQKDYNTKEGTINDGVSNLDLMDGKKVDDAFQFTLVNDHATGSLTVKFNSTSNDAFTLKAGESYSENEVSVTAIYLSNSSGVNIPYRCIFWGQD